MRGERSIPAALAAGSAIGAVLGTWRRIQRDGRTNGPAPRADAIVVFGARASPAGPSPELRARLDQAVALYAEGCARVVVCSGGCRNGISEPRAMESELRRHGVPSDAIIVDETGSSTRCTVAAASRHAEGRWRSVLAVSSPYHMHRIIAEARRQGLPAVSAPPACTPITERVATRMRYHGREVAAVWWYALTAALAPIGSDR